jgi:hypothetical protein
MINKTAGSELQEIREVEAAAIGETANKEDSQRSCFTQLAFKEELIMWDNNSVTISFTLNRSVGIQRSRENTVLS